MSDAIAVTENKPEENGEPSPVVEEEKKDQNVSSEDPKRAREQYEDAEDEDVAKKQKTDDVVEAGEAEEKPEPAPIPASKVGLTTFNDADVLSGRGGGTNVHPGNRTFRELINLHRRAYLKARKNDKPGISRTIVRSIRENNGRFLRKDEKTGLWYEIGDDLAREKTSQALRQRAPEMRKLLFDTERDEARAAAEAHLREQRMMMGMPPEAMQAAMANMQMSPGSHPMAFSPAFFMPPQGPNGKAGMPMGPSPEAYQQMYAMMASNPMNVQQMNGQMNSQMNDHQMNGGGGGGGGDPPVPSPNNGNPNNMVKEQGYANNNDNNNNSTEGV